MFPFPAWRSSSRAARNRLRLAPRLRSPSASSPTRRSRAGISAYRGKNCPTDVLSFPADGSHAEPATRRKHRQPRRTSISAASAASASGSSPNIWAISPSLPQSHAATLVRLGRTFDHEMRILILHGILHLMGYDHETDSGEMDRREKRLRRDARIALTDADISSTRSVFSPSPLAFVVFSYLDRVYRELGRVHHRTHPPASRNVRNGDRAALQNGSAPRRSRLQPARALLACSCRRDHRARCDLLRSGTPGKPASKWCFFWAPKLSSPCSFSRRCCWRALRGIGCCRSFRSCACFSCIVWPIQAVLELLISVLHLSEEAKKSNAGGRQQQAIEAFVDAATEEGIIEQDEARLIEQVVEFGDKRVRDVMTPRPGRDRHSRRRHARRIARPRRRNEILAAARLSKSRSTTSPASSWRATCSRCPTATPRTAPCAS